MNTHIFPLVDRPILGDKYYVPDFTRVGGYTTKIWGCNPEDYWYFTEYLAYDSLSLASNTTKFLIETSSAKGTSHLLRDIPSGLTTVYILNFGLYPTTYQQFPANSVENLEFYWSNELVFYSEADAKRRVRELLEALKSQFTTQYFNFLTEAPESGTVVFVPDTASNSVMSIEFDSSNETHKKLLSNCLIYSSEGDARRAKGRMVRVLNPSMDFFSYYAY